MIEVVRDRLRFRFLRSGAETGAEPGAEAEPTPEVEFVAYAEDCRLYGHIRLAGDRLTDMLNAYEEYVLVDVLAESLDSGEVAETAEVVVRREELLAVEASGPRGKSERRVRTRQHPLGLKAGPYLVEGYLHAQVGIDPLVAVRRRGPMVPITDARIAYVSGGARQLRDAVTVLVNRDHVEWIVPAADADEVAFPDVPVNAEKGPLLKDFTGQIWGIAPD
ncbi:MAG TPA: hypothetical protein VFS32_14615 [Candidatus Limnocylindrales bacterium]|nr:hypothetical protein [Candidatus Limnocylindrales bacterium]